MDKDAKTSLETKVNRFLFTFTTTPHIATGIPPAELQFKRQLRTAFHLLQPTKHRNIAYRYKIQKSTKIMTALPKFAVNDPVLVKNFGSSQRWMEGIITRQLENVNFEVETEGRVTRRHSNQIVKRPNLVPDEGVINMDDTVSGIEKTNTMETSEGARVLELVNQDEDEP